MVDEYTVGPGRPVKARTFIETLEELSTCDDIPSTQRGGGATEAPPRPLDPADRSRFRERLRRATADRAATGCCCSRWSSVVWATGFHHSPSERPVGLYVPVDGEPTLFVPLLEREHAEEDGGGVRVETYEEYPGEVPAALWMLDRVAAAHPGGPDRGRRPRRQGSGGPPASASRS
jgi:hypothetical protein